MKKKYIIPRIEISICVLESFIATSPTKNGEVDLDGEKKELPSTGEDVNIHAKQYDAWATWDE